MRQISPSATWKKQSPRVTWQTPCSIIHSLITSTTVQGSRSWSQPSPQNERSQTKGMPMPCSLKISLRQSSFLRLCFFLSVPLLLLVSCSSSAPTPTPAPQTQPQPATIVCANAAVPIGPTYPVPQTNSICSGNSLTWNHNNGHGGQMQDFIITFTPPTST